jgi:hypothetical protein
VFCVTPREILIRHRPAELGGQSWQLQRTVVSNSNVEEQTLTSIALCNPHRSVHRDTCERVVAHFKKKSPGMSRGLEETIAL